jgi:hypothetical protein
MIIDTDLFVVVGFLVMALSIPSAVVAFAEARFPVVAVVVIVMGAASIALGISGAQDGYSLARVPHSFVEILARIIN